MTLHGLIERIRKKRFKEKRDVFYDPRMLTAKEYSILCEISTLLTDRPRLFMDYDDLCIIWKKEMLNTLHSTDRDIPTNAKCSYLSSLKWGYWAMLLPITKNGFAYSCLFISIANTIMAITDLAMNSFIHQASILVRSLYEMCFTLLAVTIDPRKREVYLKSAVLEDERKVWHANFSFKALETTLNSYLSKTTDIGDALKDLENWRRNIYRGYSTAVHGNILQMLKELLVTDEKGELSAALNPWGRQAAETYTVIHDMNAILTYTNLFFSRLVFDEEIDLSIEELVTDEMRTNWIYLLELDNLVQTSYLSEVIKAEANKESENP